MDQKTHDKGLEIRKAVLGEAYVNNALKNSLQQAVQEPSPFEQRTILAA